MKSPRCHGASPFVASFGVFDINAYPSEPPPVIAARVKPILTVDGACFKEANNNGSLDRYDDWHLPIEERVADLLGRMTLEEKAGMMLIDTLNASVGGRVDDNASKFVRDQAMSRFIFRKVVTTTPATN